MRPADCVPLIRHRPILAEAVDAASAFVVLLSKSLIKELLTWQVRTDELSLVFQALADPTRRAILSRLHGGPTTVGELAEPFAMSRPAISQHLKVLERAGLIERTATRSGARAPCAPSRSTRHPPGSNATAASGTSASTCSTSNSAEMKRTDAMPEQTAPQRKQFTITRIFDAPRDAGLARLDRPRRMPRPGGIRAASDQAGQRRRSTSAPGGRYAYTMVNPADGTEYPTAGVYREIVAARAARVHVGRRPATPTTTRPSSPSTCASSTATAPRCCSTCVGIAGRAGDEDVYDGWDSAFDLLAEHLADGGAR